VKFISAFAIVFTQIFFINLLQVVKVEGTFGILTLMYGKVFSFFSAGQCMGTIGTSEGKYL
jgi:hypothetical protein